MAFEPIPLRAAGPILRRNEMRNQQFPTLQSGVALVFSLLLLLVLTIIGVAAMNSTIMQERMAGNLRMQTQVFEVASEGVTRALDYYYDNTTDVDGVVGHEDGLLCGFVHSTVAGTSVVDNQLAWRYPSEGFDLIQLDHGDGLLQLEQQMYCCRSWAEVEVGGETVWMENPSKLFVLSRGTFVPDEDADALARREVEVRLDEADPGLPTCALCIPGGVDSFEAGKSQMAMHGACGPAITTHDAGSAQTIVSGIDDKRIGNYDGGIVSGEMGPLWDNPNRLAEFIWWLKLGLDLAYIDGAGHAGYWDYEAVDALSGGGHPTRINPQHFRFTGSPEFGVQSDIEDGDYGQPRITYFDRSVYMGGSVTGHGIMIVNGEVEWGGVPDFEGLLISIGGSFEVSGGGGGGGRGSLVMTSLDFDNDSLRSFAEASASRPEGRMPAAFGSREELRYPVATDGDGHVRMYDPDEFEFTLEDTDGNAVEDVPVRPMLHDSLSRDLIHYYDGDHRFFRASNGEEIDPDVIELDPASFQFRFLDPGDPSEVLGHLNFQNDANRPRDKYGRLIPNFVPLDGWADNWPHPALEYHPNRWGWGLCGSADEPEFCGDPPFRFESSAFEWDGGGGQNFTYDCRRLQRLRQRLLCEDQAKLNTGQADFPPAGYEYDDPDNTLLCEHHEWATEYNNDVLDLGGNLHNNYPWHLWDPTCECLGITSESDMILSGWRENLGWRDDDFAACAGLPGPSNDD
jgi:hypothetical protein